MEVHLYAWIITVVVMVAILVIDVLIIGRRPHEPSMKEAGLFIGIYVTLAVLFGFGVWAIAGAAIRGRILCRLDHRIQPLDRQPVHLLGHLDQAEGPPSSAAVRTAGRDHLGARFSAASSLRLGRRSSTLSAGCSSSSGRS